MLAPYDPIAELYDGYPGDYLEDIVFFAEEAIASGGPVLEIGAGTGRLSLCLAAVGVEVVGIDASVEVLRVLVRKRARQAPLRAPVWPIAADMRNFALRRKFPLVIVPFRTFLYLLTNEDRERALRTIRAHLAPGGKLILAFFVPPHEIVSLDRTPEVLAARFPAPEGEEEVWPGAGPSSARTSSSPRTCAMNGKTKKETRYARSPTRSPRATSSRRRCRPSWTAAALK